MYITPCTKHHSSNLKYKLIFPIKHEIIVAEGIRGERISERALGQWLVCETLSEKTTMANPRRNSISFSSSTNPQSLESPFHSQSQGRSLSLSLALSFSHLKNFLKKPHAFPFLLSVFLLLTWISLRIQHSSSRFSSPNSSRFQQTPDSWSKDDDLKANLVRFKSGFPSPIAKDNRGWLLDPISLALGSGITGTPIVFASGFNSSMFRLVCS